MMVQMKETLPATEVKTCCLDIDFRKRTDIMLKG